MPIVIKLDGIEALTQRLHHLTDDLATEVDAEIGFAVDKLIDLAIQDAPADEGRLRQSINKNKLSQMNYEVVVQTEYAAFVEFGTRGKVQVEPGFEDYARQFQGQTSNGATFKDFVIAIAGWIHRKGIAGVYSTGVKRQKGGGFVTGGKAGRRRGARVNQIAEDYQLAYAIALSIWRNGIDPHPFLFHNFATVGEELVQNVKNILFSITT